MTDTPTEPLQQQLFRYAQDLQELMEQQSRLQRRHRKVLQFLRRDDQWEDPLLQALLQSFKTYLVTNMHGEIMRTSSAAEKLFSPSRGNINWISLDQLMPEEQGQEARILLGEYIDQSKTGAIQQTKLRFNLTSAEGHAGIFDALILRGGNGDESAIYWFLSEQVIGVDSDLKIQSQLPIFDGGVIGLILTDANRHTCAVNHAFTTITGYSRSDVIGKDPRFLSSGLQDAVFYRALWNDLNSLGSWTGEFFNRRKSGQVFFESVTLKAVRNTANETIAYLGAFVDMSHHESGQDHLEILTPHDPLTGLHNRPSFERILKQALSESNNLWVLLISVDHFRTTADELGHECGDRLLSECGARLRALMRPGDTLARIGGGVFGLLVLDVPEKLMAESVALTMRGAFKDPIDVEKKLLVVTVSMGCAGFQNIGADASKALQQADTAMQMSRRLSGRLCFFAEEL